MKRALLLSILVGCIATTHGASADEQVVDAAAKAAADALFKEARQLMTSERYAEACPKFAESQRLDPAAGTLLNLADCFEKNGQTASAWATFGEASRAAELRKRADWKATADSRIRALEPTLSFLFVNVDPETARLPNLVIVRDGLEVRRAQWGTAIPIDPGAHEVIARAPQHGEWRTTVKLKNAGDRQTIQVPALPPLTVSRENAEVTPPSPPPPSPRRSSGLTTLGVVSLGAGVVGLGTGVVFGLLASNKASKVDTLCPSTPCSDTAGLEANDAAHTYATISTVGVVAGGALSVLGVVLLLWPSPSSSPSARMVVVPSVGTTGGELVMVRRF